MLLTHLVLLEFFTGASGAAAGDTFSGFTTHMPLAFFDGFSGAADGGGGSSWSYNRKRRR